MTTLLQSALSRPRNLLAYGGPAPDLASLAAGEISESELAGWIRERMVSF